MIELKRVSMHYELGAARIEVLKGVDMAVARGERVAIVGPSGSGKTTLLVLLAGLERPTAGSVAIDGVRLDTLSSDELADLRRDHIGIVFQSFHLVPTLDALDNVALPLQIAGHRDATKRAREQLARVGLADRLAHYPAQPSSRAASSSASRSRAPWCMRPKYCSPTSRPAIWTTTPPKASGTCCSN
jgi:putative ABC transport system ATP-binding protein